MKARRFMIQGRVQGVGFRYFALQRAHAAGVKGFARNNPDGTVEVWAEGLEKALAIFEADLRQGPAMSRVENVWVDLVMPRGEGTFEIR